MRNFYANSGGGRLTRPVCSAQPEQFSVPPRETALAAAVRQVFSGLFILPRPLFEGRAPPSRSAEIRDHSESDPDPCPDRPSRARSPAAAPAKAGGAPADGPQVS